MEQKQLLFALEQICDEKGISRQDVIATIEAALAAAYKKDYGKKGQVIRVKFEPETGKMEVYKILQVVIPSQLKEEKEKEEKKGKKAKEEEIAKEDEKTKEETESEEKAKIRFNPEKHILLEEAKKIKPEIKKDEELLIPLPVKTDFGRIAAQTAKQVIIQRIREAERNSIYTEFKKKEGELTRGIVQRVENLPSGERRGKIDELVFIEVGRTVGLLYPNEQIQTETYRVGQHLKVYILRVEQQTKGPVITLSRSHPEMVKKLFALEIPEIQSGVVEIKSIAREAGSRTKIAVSSSDEKVDPVGSCVGQRGTRIQMIINELGGEKIDIIEWSPSIEKFIAHALSPAKVINVEIQEKERLAIASVPWEQLSLAIGRNGQNVRLAAKLTGWRIDVVEAKVEAKEAETAPEKEAKEEVEKETEKEAKEKEGKEIKK